MSERTQYINRLSGYAAVFLSVVALLVVPAILVFLATADWKTPWRSVRPLVAAFVVLVLAFGALYYLENVRDPNYHRARNHPGARNHPARNGLVGRGVVL